MKLPIALSLFLCLLLSCRCESWAVLVAGSNTYANYRHQSDIYHAYQILIKNKFNPDRIITFAFDDLAHNLKNPFKGKIFNKPSYKDPGVDVYEGVRIDYSGKLVTPENFVAVLNGNKTAVQGKGTGRVLESTANDNVFIYFSDHGAPGLIAFPSEYLHADKLMTAFDKMKGMYSKLVFYLEACESGSMFTKLPNNTKIYALSAANPSESSWGYYCSPDDIVQGKHIGSCLGDLFSINFLENTESIDINTENLSGQFEVIRKLTTKSHVMQWGDLSFQGDMLSQYIGASSGARLNLKRRVGLPLASPRKYAQVDSRFGKIIALSEVYHREQTLESLREMREEMLSMQRFDGIFSSLAKDLQLRGAYDADKLNHECMREVISGFEAKCGRLSDYGLIYVKYVAEACQSMQASTIKDAISCEKQALLVSE